MTYRIGVDGGATKTECILVDGSGATRARHVAGGSNPNTAGPEQAAAVLTGALRALLREAGPLSAAPPSATLLCMAGRPDFWREFAAGLAGFGKVTACDDSLPVLELATDGKPGLVLHAGTGSFVAARAPDGSARYAGGLGWRFGDPGGAYDIGRRAVARALLERQGWAGPTRLGGLVCGQAGLSGAAGLVRYFYEEPSPNAKISALAPAILRAAGEGDAAAVEIVAASASELLDFGVEVAARIFGRDAFGSLRAGLSGPVLTHPALRGKLEERSPFRLFAVEGAPIEGVRRMLVRMG